MEEKLVCWMLVNHCVWLCNMFLKEKKNNPTFYEITVSQSLMQRFHSNNE